MKLKSILVFLALSLCAAAQTKQVPSPNATLTGLPQFGVTIAGPAEDPILVNHSKKALVAALLLVTQANGKVRVLEPMMVPPTESLAAGAQTQIAHNLSSHSVHGVTEYPISTIELLAVVFADGEMLGQDRYGFQSFVQTRFVGLANLGKLASAGNWAEIANRAKADVPGDGLGFFSKNDAQHLIDMRNGLSENVARTLASQYQKMPQSIVKH